jgi:hypothetical protein
MAYIISLTQQAPQKMWVMTSPQATHKPVESQFQAWAEHELSMDH